jgi:hypothetical protein
MKNLKDYLEKLGIADFPKETNFKIEKIKYFYNNIDKEIGEELYYFLSENLPKEFTDNVELKCNLDCMKEDQLKYIFLAKMYFVCESFNDAPLDTVSKANDYVKFYLDNEDDFFLDEFENEREFKIIDFVKNNSFCFNVDEKIIKEYNLLFNKMYLTSIYHNCAKKTKCYTCDTEVYFFQLTGYENKECNNCENN